MSSILLHQFCESVYSLNSFLTVDSTAILIVYGLRNNLVAVHVLCNHKFAAFGKHTSNSVQNRSPRLMYNCH